MTEDHTFSSLRELLSALKLWEEGSSDCFTYLRRDLEQTNDTFCAHSTLLDQDVVSLLRLTHNHNQNSNAFSCLYSLSKRILSADAARMRIRAGNGALSSSLLSAEQEKAGNIVVHLRRRVCKIHKIENEQKYSIELHRLNAQSVPRDTARRCRRPFMTLS